MKFNKLVIKDKKLLSKKGKKLSAITLESPILKNKFGVQSKGKNEYIKCSILGIKNELASAESLQFYNDLKYIDDYLYNKFTKKYEKMLARDPERIANKIFLFQSPLYETDMYDPLVTFKVNYRENQYLTTFKYKNDYITMADFKADLDNKKVKLGVTLNFVYLNELENEIISGYTWGLNYITRLN